MGRGGACRGCLRIRLFLGAALPLVAMIYLQPAMALRLSRHLPDSGSIGWAIVIGAGVVFVLRLVLWRRQAGGQTPSA